jgi:hypothetical protein
MGNGRQVTSVRQLQVPALRYRLRYLSSACNESVGVLREANDEAGDRDLGQSGQLVLVAGDELGRPLPELELEALLAVHSLAPLMRVPTASSPRA